MARKKVYYFTRGLVRGWCGHKHRSVDAAIRCLEQDRRRCRSQGGYSDRHVAYRTPEGDVFRVHTHYTHGGRLVAWDESTDIRDRGAL